MTMYIDREIVLIGRIVRLEPLRVEHAEALFAIAQDDDIWRYLAFDRPASVGDMRRWIDAALALAEQGTVVPFVILNQADGAVAGSTRYMEIVPHDHCLEIGWTWLGRAYWRTPVNTECKYLLLRHAFEQQGAMRVQLKTDLRNLRSQQAIARLGAVREGVLREHRIVKGGYRRSSVMFSILDHEWPAVKAELEAKLLQG